MKLKRWKLLTVLIAAFVLVATVSVSVYAYFSTRVYVYTEDGKEVAHLGMNLQLLFGKLDQSLVGTEIPIPYYRVDETSGKNVFEDPDSETYTEITYNMNAPWGSPQNPYIIANERHLQNLSALQNIGYFDMMYIENNFTYNEGTATYTYNDGISMPYFLICDQSGAPVVINASKISAIRPVGSAEHPFIGVVGGAFASGDPVIVGETGKTTSVSTLHGVKVQTNTDQTDVGLFGYVGYLGTEPTDTITDSEGNTVYKTQFTGATSILQDFLLSDVQIVVKEPGLDETLSKIFGPIWEAVFGPNGANSNNHRFSYTNSGETNPPEEDHHIGILAGHVSYATVENISVYYSSNSIYALDVTGTNSTDNYYSESGILGFMYNMNALVQNQTDADSGDYSNHCQIMMGTGTTSDDMEIPVVGSGSGTGGGALSGNGRGYVTAAEIFSDYNNVNVGQKNNELLWNYQPKGGNLVTGAILILQKPDGTYTFADGETVATLNGTASVTYGTNTWTKFFIRTGTGKDGDFFSYKDPSGVLITSVEMTGNLIHGKEIWKYQAGGDGIWHYGVRINFDGTKYTLDDGDMIYTNDENEETVTINTNVRPVKPTATIDGTACVFENFFIVNTATNEVYIFDPFVTNTKIAVTSYNLKPLDLIAGVSAPDENGTTTLLCTEWMRERILGFLGISKEATGMYYFTDGVFTFALSSQEDTIRDTWENNKAPTIYLGEDDHTKWETNPATGNKAVVALLTPVTDNATLDAAIDAGKQVYISARPSGANTEALLMSLLTNGASPASIPGQMLEIDNTLKESLRGSYASGAYTVLPTVPHTGAADTVMEVDLDTMKTKDFWKDYTVLNIGRTSASLSLTELRDKYNVAATPGNTNYYFRNDTGVSVTPSAQKIPEYYYYDGYFFYTVDARDGDSGTTHFDFTLYYKEAGNGETIQIDAYSTTQWLDSSIRHNNISNLVDTISFTTAYNAEGNTGGEDLYSYTYDGKTVTAPLLYMNDNQFVRRSGGRYNRSYTPTTTAYVNGSIAAKATNSTLDYYIWDAASNKFYQANESTEMSAAAADAEDAKADGTAGKLYRVNKYPSYQFSSNYKDYTNKTDASYLQLLREYTTSTLGNLSGSKYSIWAGTQTQYDNLSMERGQEKKGVLVFEDDYCYIRYFSGAGAQYVNWSYSSTTSSGSFSGSVDKGANNKLYVYIIEGIIDMDYGVNTFIPSDYGEEGSTSLGLPADQYVFWPQTTLKQDGVYSANGATLENTTENATMATTTDPIYSLYPLCGDADDALNWGTETGYILGSPGEYSLYQKFQMADQAGFGRMYNLLGGNWEPGGDGYTMLVAPIGSNGVEATIPKGCVAFRVNSGGEQTVRIIVAVPTTELYVGETGFGLDLVNDYYIGVWNVAAANEGTYFDFNKSDALEKFELPRSYTFDFEHGPEDEETVTEGATYKNHVDVSYGGNNYRTYLNGGTMLVAYEFTVSGEGVYIIGSVHGTNNAKNNLDVPMEIVHFSVSGTASAGRDGIAGSKLGSVDFVYDQNDAIITVDKTGLTGGLTNAADNENYANYYASQCLLHTNNAAKDDVTGNYVLINNARVSIRRYVKPVVVTDADGNSATYGETTIAYVVGPPNSGQQKSVVVEKYMTNADTVERTEETDSTS